MSDFSIHGSTKIIDSKAVVKRDGSGWISFDIKSNHMFSEQIEKDGITLFSQDIHAFLNELKTKIEELEMEVYG
ncbi:MAG TPA: hypothetical protein EYO59_04645 [Chromatiaceae bacterium]|jgi:hypothetical protein|nr:hypothetical protein [Chromatiaceae bacterium]